MEPVEVWGLVVSVSETRDMRVGLCMMIRTMQEQEERTVSVRRSGYQKRFDLVNVRGVDPRYWSNYKKEGRVNGHRLKHDGGGSMWTPYSLSQ